MKVKLKRFLSSLLVAALLLQMAPFEALASDDVSPPVGVIPADENGNAVEPVDEDPIYATDENGDPIYDEESGKAEDAYIVGEAYDARDEFQKDYRLSDGSFIAVEYGVPVHYEEDGEWQDIDNRLEPIAMYDGTDVYQTVNGDVSQSFSASLEDGSIMASSSGDSMLSVSLWDGASSEEKPVAVDLDTEPDTEPDEAESDEPDSTQVPDSAPEAADAEDQAEVTAEPKQVENTDSTVADETVLPEDESTDEETSDSEAEPAPEANPEEQEPTAEAEPEEETEEQDQLLPFNRDATAKIAEDDLVSAVATYQSTSEEPRSKTDVIPAALQSTVLYEDVYEGVDLQYDLFSYNIKESIVLKAPQEKANDPDAASTPYRYCFRLDLANLTPTLQEDGSILMTDDQEQPVYEIPTPFMIDANGEFSDAVTYSLTQLEDSYLLTVEADAQWLEAEERAYPVTIDPTIFSKENESKFTGATAAQYSATSSVSGTQMACGYHSTHGEMQMYFHIDQLPKVDVGNTVVDAKVGLNMTDYIPKYNSSAKSVLAIRNVPNAPTGTSWLTSLTWNSKPAYDCAMDYVITHGNEIGSYRYWNVTRAAKDWYANGSTSCNLAVTSDQTSSTSYRAWFNYSYTAVVIISYRNTTGIESYYTYEEQNILRAGNGYVGDYSSSLTIVKDDLSYSSTSLPFTLSHVYNSDLYSGNISDSWLLGVTAADYINMRTGFGWQLSAQESVGKTTIGGTTYLVYRDGDGTMHFFTYDSSSGKYKDEDGLNLTIAAGTSGGITTYTMTDEDGNTRFFYNSYLTYIKDANGNRICFVYNGGNFSATGTGWYPSTNGSYLSAIYAVSSSNTSYNKICTLAYDQNHYLASITDYAGRTTTFNYSDLTGNSAYLTKVTHPDGTTVTYEYDAGRLNRAYDAEAKYGMAYKYSGGGISEFWEYDNTTWGSWVLRHKNGVQETYYRYVGDDRQKGGSDDTVTKYTFDFAGRTINAVTLDNTEREVLGVTAAAYTTNTARSGKNNRVEKDAQSGQNGINLLVAGGLESHDSFSTAASYWTRVTYPDDGSYSKKNAVVKTGESARHGTGALKSYLNNAATADSNGVRYAGMYQTVTLSPGTYTFSAYVNTTGMVSCDTNGGVYAAFADENGNFLARGIKVNYATNADVDNGWERIYVTYTVPADGTYRCMVLAENAYGSIYYDDLQLERGSAASTTNLLQNGWFQSINDPQEWTDTNLYLYKDTSNDSNYIGYLWGSPYGMKRASQTIPINKPATDTYLLSGWGAAYAAADNETALTDSTAENNSKRYFGLIARCNYSDGTKEYFYMPFNDDYPLWQYASCVIAPKKANQSKTLSSITVILAYDGNFNDKEFYSGAAFDNISLRQEPCNTYTYDSDGNVTAVNATGNSSASFKYAAGTTDLTESNTKSSGTYKYTYNSNHLVTKIKNDGVTMDISYDASGNSTGTTLSSDSNSAVGKIVTSAAYSADGSQLLSQTDANGSTTSYTYSNQRLVSTQTDGNGVVNRHSYNSNNDRPSVNYQTNVVSTAYEYSCGNLVTLRRSSFATTDGPKRTQTYSMGYDSFGNMTSISVGSRQLASYDYGSQNGNLRSMTYGNGATVSYTYDIFDRVSEEKWGDTLKYQYFYNAEGDLAKKLDVTTGKAVNYEYDSLDRLIHSNQTENGTVTSQTEHIYDTENRLKRFTYSIPGVIDSAAESFYYNENTADGIPDGSLTSMALFNNSWIYYRYDSLFRRTERDIGSVLTEHQSFAAGSTSGTTTMRPETYYTTAKGSTTKLSGFQYTYDKVGNIKKIVNQVDSSYWNYSYDSLGQLRFASEYQSNGVASNRYKYFYDNAGNLTSWVIQDNSGTVTKVSHTYSYDDADWLDLLTAFDGETITYDGAGNPLSYYNGSRYTFTWQNGRQLASTNVGGVAYNYQYDASGIRTRKTNFDGGYTEYYVVEGLAVAEDRFRANGTKQYTLRYLYDESNSPVGFGIRYATSSPYWQYYYFGKNIQGDVIALYRSDYNSSSQSYYPTLVATYSYDPWGTPTGIYDASGNAISQTAYNVAAYNPFRYRGYRYDGDTRLYYLQSRYYDPAIGRFINADSPNFVLTNPYSNGITDKNYFAYCDNNPINRNDDGGEFWNIVVGAIVGGVVSAAITAVDSYISTGHVDGDAVLHSAVSGAIAGGVAATGVGIVGQRLVGAATSAMDTFYSEVREQQKGNSSMGRVIIKTAISAGWGALTAGPGMNTKEMKGMRTAARAARKTLQGSGVHPRVKKIASRSVKTFWRYAKKQYSSAAKDSIIYGAFSWGLGKIVDYASR